MISKEHKKHADVLKPKGGKFHFNEIAFLGAPCGTIQKLAKQLSNSVTSVKIAYVDADHGEGKNPPSFQSQYTDKIGFHEVQFSSQFIDFEYRPQLAAADVCIVNGNHFKAESQIVIINAKKEDSLQRKLDRLTDLKCFILDEGMEQPFEFLFQHNAEWRNLPVIKLTDYERISDFISRWHDSQKALVNGLVLAGGKSTRMGHDKSKIDYHGKPHSVYLASLLEKYCEKTFLSKAKPEDPIAGFGIIADSFLDLGPFGGILSAFRYNPNAAWLTVATDVPLLNEETLKLLINERDPSKFATCFHNPETQFPEPLITIWEPRAYPKLLQFLSMGYSCPRKSLINSDIKEVHLDNTQVLANANTPDEMKKIRGIIADG